MKDLGILHTDQPATEAALTHVAGRLRAAVRSEAYEDIPELLAEHNRQLQQVLHEVSGDTSETRRLATQAREMLDWVRASVLANRAHAQASLSRLSNAARYLPATGPAGADLET